MTPTDPLAALKSRKLAIVGYGNHGRSHALNLRDSGVETLRIGLREGSPSRAKAEAEGFTIGTVAEVAAWADAVSILAADEAHAEIWENDIAPNRPHGQALMFCHGYSIRYGLLDPAPDADIILAAAKGPGGAVRTEYEKGRGLIGYWAVHRDASGTARDLAIAYLGAAFSLAWRAPGRHWLWRGLEYIALAIGLFAILAACARLGTD